MDINYDTLRDCPLFDGIPQESFGDILEQTAARLRRFRKGKHIAEQGDKARYIGIVLTGRVQIERVDFDGTRSIVSTLAPAMLFGESVVCAGVKQLHVSIIAAADSEVILADGRKITENPALSYNLMKIMAEKNLMLNRKIDILSKRTTAEKLLTYLSYQAQQSGSDSFTVPYDRQELADFLRVDRSGLSAEISRLRREGMIECRKNQFRLCGFKAGR